MRNVFERKTLWQRIEIPEPANVCHFDEQSSASRISSDIQSLSCDSASLRREEEFGKYGPLHVDIQNSISACKTILRVCRFLRINSFQFIGVEPLHSILVSLRVSPCTFAVMSDTVYHILNNRQISKTRCIQALVTNGRCRRVRMPGESICLELPTCKEYCHLLGC